MAEERWEGDFDPTNKMALMATWTFVSCMADESEVAMLEESQSVTSVETRNEEKG